MPRWSGHANRLNKIRTPGDGRRGGFETRPYRIRYDIAGKDVVLHRVRHRREIYRLE